MNLKKKIEEVEFKNSRFTVELEYYFDEDIEEYFLDEELGNKNLRKIRNEYRRLNNLLLDYNIKQIREKYGLSQKDFALLLGLGEVTITRYESKTIQDKAQDEIIRSAKNPDEFYQIAQRNKEKFIKEYSEEKFLNVLETIKAHSSKNFIEMEYLRRSFPNELVGECELSLEKIYAIIKQFCLKIKKLTKTKLAKFLWYVDFLSFKNTNKGMTGLSYCHLPYGAVPFLYEELLNSQLITMETSFSNDSTTCVIKDCYSNYILNEEEYQIIDKVIDKFKDMNTKQVVMYMHNEKAFIDTNNNEFISYSYATDLLI